MYSPTRSARSLHRASRFDAIVAILGCMAGPREETPPDVHPHTNGQIIAQSEQNRCHSGHSGLYGRAARGDPSRQSIQNRISLEVRALLFCQASSARCQICR